MSANLTLQYHKAERDYRRARTPQEQFACLQRMLRELPKHKGTDKLQADIKQRISRVKELLRSPQKGAGKQSYRLPRQGAGRAVLIGPPNVGKSQLLACLTNATPEIADYPYTTRTPQPAMMPWEDVLVQLVDTPPIMAEAITPAIQDILRGADLALLLVDLSSDETVQQAVELWNHLQQSKTRLGTQTCFDLNDFGVSYTQTLLVPNKTDLPQSEDHLASFHQEVDSPCMNFPISALNRTGIEELRTAIYQALDVIRIYTKTPTNKEPDFSNPITLRTGETVLDLAQEIHQEIAKSLKFARIWGTNVHDGTHVKGDHPLDDQDIVELHY